MIGLDQFGNRYPITNPKFPRKSLLDYLGAKHADKIYRDTKNGTKHVGYVIQGNWISLYVEVQK
jgi:hypothetical protein